MKIPSFREIRTRDFPEVPTWLESLMYPINSFLQLVSQAMQGQLTIGDNVQGQYKSITFTTLSDYSLGNWTVIDVSTSLVKKVDAVLIAQINKQSSIGEVITLPVSLDWKQVNTVVKLNYIAGLEDNVTYTAKLLIL